MPILKLDDAEIHYETAGTGPALIFLSATAWHGGVWSLHQVPYFSRTNQVIVFDQRGTGKSKTTGEDFSTERLAEDAIRLLNHLGLERASLVGHSNGGRVAQMLTLLHPHRVDKLVLASAGATHASKGIPLGMCVELVEKGYIRYFRDHSIATGVSKSFAAAHPEQLEAFLRELTDNLTPLETFLRYVIGRQQSDTTSRLGEIRAPTLVLIGENEDHGSSSGATHMDFARTLAHEIPNSRLVVLKDQGHFYPFLAAHETNEIIAAFLTDDELTGKRG
jgi:pimeloyl-ACP methyl ester carboxylesterase